MITATLRHALPCTVDQFWSFYLDDAFLHANFVDGLGWSPPRIVEKHDADGVWRRVVHCEPKLSLPPAVAKLMQTTLGFVETASFDRDSRVQSLRHVTNIFGERLDMRGTIRAEPRGEEGCIRIGVMSIECRIPLVGGLIERAVESNMQKGFDGSAAFIPGYLRRNA